MKKLTTIMLGAALLCGCQSKQEQATHCALCKNPPLEDLAFFAEERQEESAVTRILNKQSDRGAAHDAMLRGAHFNGSELNRLGELKLEAIVRGTREGEPVVVYLDLAEGDEQTAVRQEAVEAFLQVKGISDDLALVLVGDNPGARHMATLTSNRRYTVEEGNLTSTINEDSDSSSQTQQVPMVSTTPVGH